MRRLLTVVGMLVALSVPVGAQDEKPLTAKEIMGKLNKGPNSLCPTIGKDLRADPPAWEQIQKETKDFAALAGALTKAKPPRGEQESWDKLCKAYAESATALDEAADKKDKKAVQAAHAKLADMKSCKACHSAHRK
jgi:hypothetical protein